MYVFPEMIDMGLDEGQEWPNEIYKMVAQSILLCNPMITSRDDLTNGVQKVLLIPDDKIREITFADLPDYGFEQFVG